jgi:hypothetical protein
MPPSFVRTLGRVKLRLSRVTAILCDTEAERRWCEREAEGFTAAGVYTELRAAPGMIALYRERAKKRWPLFSRTLLLHHAPPKTTRIRARVRRLNGKWGVATVDALAREYRCAFCGRGFLLDEHGQEYVADAGDIYTHVHTGANKHSRCCRDCLPGLRARLPVCDEDAARDRAVEAWRRNAEAER